MYLSLATATVHTTQEWQPRSERGEPLPWLGDHIFDSYGGSRVYKSHSLA